jgi:hypothetical protein
MTMVLYTIQAVDVASINRNIKPTGIAGIRTWIGMGGLLLALLITIALPGWCGAAPPPPNVAPSPRNADKPMTDTTSRMPVHPSPRNADKPPVAPLLPRPPARPMTMYHPRALSVDETCRQIGAKLGSVSVEGCKNQQLRLSGGKSVLHVPILLKEYPPLPGHKAQGRILLIGGIHGDEYSSVSIVFRWMDILDVHHSGKFHWRVTPLVNPDGLLQTTSQRTNHNGVDLNRNFPTRDWKNSSRSYWVTRTSRDPRRFPGEYPLSEPESRWIVREIQEFKPDVIISIHAPLGLLDFDGPPKDPPKKLGHIYLSLLGTYPGSMGRFAGEELGIPVITIELPYAGIMPSQQEIIAIWSDLINWLTNHVHAHGHVTP